MKKMTRLETMASLLIAGVVIYYMASRQYGEANPAPRADVNASWEELVSEYGSNEIAFADRYKNATFHLSGKVVKVSDGAGPTVSIITDGGTSLDAGFFYNQSDRLKGLAPSDIIEFHCLRFNSSIDVDRCKLDSVKKAEG
ncbi:MAG TPA: hypothetical protein VMA74_14575 [Dyella sp.]|uniref:hypothetical protein n=1 Tax=Dyella sp. TaxID=1869338 RepID=UPI002C69BE96|nr:hypothetical protein [Dyella sp.]HUB90947.1 hypothetical protein [Dyella sp.]